MKPQKRTLWKLLLSLTLVLTVGVAATWLFVRQAQQRTTFFGEVGPLTGYRYRITLSAGWKKEESADTTSSSSFVEPPWSPIQQWIDRHLLRRKVAKPLNIDLASYPLNVFPMDTGYPELTPVQGERILIHRHFPIDGGVATLMATDDPSQTQYQYREHLLIYVSASTTVYNVIGFSEPSDADRLDREMQGVIASFHTEKVPVPRADLEVMETAMSDWQARHGREHKQSGDDEVVVYNRCLEDFKPQSSKLVLSDTKAFLLEMKRYAPDGNVFLDNYMVSRPPWKKLFPHAFACIYPGRPTYPDNETAVLKLIIAESSGKNTNRYTLKRKQGKWSIVQRDVQPWE